MTKRTALFSTLFVGLLLFGFSQVGQLQNVHAQNAPITSPVTSPASLFTISGKITKKSLQWHSLLWRFMPIGGVVVRLENIFTHHSMTTMTGSDGVYTFPVDEKGVYKISPKEGSMSGFFVPPLRFVILKKHDTLHEDFQLLDLH